MCNDLFTYNDKKYVKKVEYCVAKQCSQCFSSYLQNANCGRLVEFNVFDKRAASALEFLAQCNSRSSNPSGEVEVKRRTHNAWP
jgi:hypothetical protein